MAENGLRGVIGPVSKVSYTQVAKDAEARASLDFDIMEHTFNQVEKHIKNQPVACGKQMDLCSKRFVKMNAARIVLGILVTLLIVGGFLPWSFIAKVFALI